jgi:hypothetical protein
MRVEEAQRKSASGDDLEEAEECVREACELLVRAGLRELQQAGGRLARAAEIVGRWQPSTGRSARSLELHRSVERAGSLLEAVRRWCEHRRSMLLPERATPPGYGADGRPLAAPASASMAFQG